MAFFMGLSFLDPISTFYMFCVLQFYKAQGKIKQGPEKLANKKRVFKLYLKY